MEVSDLAREGGEMSEGVYTDTESGDLQSAPRAVVHKRILEEASSKPGATMEDLADRVTGATIDLVDRVLEEYGDPGVNESDDETDDQVDTEDVSTEAEEESTEAEEELFEPDPEGGTMAESQLQNVPTSPDLTEKQRETLTAIREHPEATQAELADLLGVTPATINARVNSISGFDWNNRHNCVESMLDNDNEPLEENEYTEGQDGQADEIVERLEKLDERVRVLEERKRPGTESGPRALCDPEFVHKILHACLESDRISDEEELQILEAMLGHDGDSE